MQRMVTRGKRIPFAAGVLAIETPAFAGTNRCERVLCLPCPDGYVLSPQGGNCCRCVRVG